MKRGPYKGSIHRKLLERSEELRAIISESKSIRECFYRLNLPLNGSASVALRLVAEELKISIAHFRIGNNQNYRLRFDQLRKAGSRKKRLLEIRGARCEMADCGIVEWHGLPAPLQLDHIDGNKYNNEESNLRIICANCHAQTETFCGRNHGKYALGTGS